MRTAFLTARRLLKEIPGIPYADEDLGQIDNFDTKPSVPPGSVLISLAILSTNMISDKRQRCRLAITLRHWCDVPMQETSSIAPDEIAENSLKYYDTIEAVYKAFQGYYDDELDTFDRQSDVKETRRDKLVVRRSVYITTYEDRTAEEV